MVSLWTVVHPGWLALTVTVCVPSIRASSTTVRLNVAESWPARTVTVAGTVTSEVSLELSTMCTSAPGAAPSVTKPASASVPSPSVALAGAMATSMVVVSLSVTPIVSLPST